MDEEALTQSMRKFLKRVGVTSQQAIEKALREADEAGTLNSDKVTVKATLTIEAIDLHHEIEGELTVGDGD